jgi:hypothetical protein
MEALVVAIAALIALVLIDAGCWIAASLVRWSPVIILGMTATWLATRHGSETFEAIGIGFIAGVGVRFLLIVSEHQRY